MANHKATKKSIVRNAVETERNNSRRNRVRTFIRKVESCISAGNKQDAQSAFKLAQSEIAKGVTKGIFKLNTASRKIKRLAEKVKNIA